MSIQDSGRIGYMSYGVPISGAMDSYAASFANALLGNSDDSAVLEMTMTGATLQALSNTWICLSGANMSPKIDDSPVSNNKVLQLKKGSVLSFGKLNVGFRCYLAVSGGFRNEKILGSQSMYQGITKQNVLMKGDELHIYESDEAAKVKNASVRTQDEYFETKDIEVFEGPEFHLLSLDQQNKLFSQDFTISKDNSRMAYQLVEPLPNEMESIITSSVLPGTVQLTPSGKLIILMRDCQTTGGYPRVLQLKDKSLNAISQKFTGKSIRFKPC